MLLENPDNHIFLTSSADVDNIARPLREHLGITGFFYQRNFKDGSEVRISNQPAWIRHYYEKEYYSESVYDSCPNYRSDGYVLWNQLTSQEKILSEAREFDIDHGITFIKPKIDGCEFFFFSTKRSNHGIIMSYLNNIDLLERFIMYFKDKGKKIIDEACENKIYISKKYDNNDNAGFLKEIIDENKRNNFIRDTKISKIEIDDGAITLSSREIEIGIQLIYGDTAQAISEEMFISRRTVESHINNLKNKLHCSTKSELIKKLIIHIGKLIK